MNWIPLLLRLMPGCVLLAAIAAVSSVTWQRTTPVKPLPVETAKDIETRVPETAFEPIDARTDVDRAAEPDLGANHQAAVGEDQSAQPPIWLESGRLVVALPDLAKDDTLQPQHPKPKPVRRSRPVAAVSTKPPPERPRDWTDAPGPRWPTLMVRARPDTRNWRRDVFFGQ